MKRVFVAAYLTLAILCASISLTASNASPQDDQKIEWIRQFGTENDDCGMVLAIDTSGNLYVAGMTSGTFPGQTSSGAQDVFLAKFNPAGCQLWVRQFGTSRHDFGNGVAVDTWGNIYVSGFTQGGTFPGQVNLGGEDAFLAKYDSNGNQIWIRVWNGPG